MIVGERHLGHVVKEFMAHSNAERPHRAKGNMPRPEADEPEPQALKVPTGEVKCKERLGGLLKHDYRVIA